MPMSMLLPVVGTCPVHQHPAIGKLELLHGVSQFSVFACSLCRGDCL
jgi:hypothetical protein